MNLLLDAHSLLWSYFEPGRLGTVAAKELSNSQNRVFVSPAGLWELAIKISIGKLKIAEPFTDFVRHSVSDNGFSLLPIEPPHTATLIGLPFHHRDPFDRLLIAQAMVEDLEIVSGDRMFALYPIRLVW